MDGADEPRKSPIASGNVDWSVTSGNDRLALGRACIPWCGREEAKRLVKYRSNCACHARQAVKSEVCPRERMIMIGWDENTRRTIFQLLQVLVCGGLGGTVRGEYLLAQASHDFWIHGQQVTRER